MSSYSRPAKTRKLNVKGGPAKGGVTRSKVNRTGRIGAAAKAQQRDAMDVASDGRSKDGSKSVTTVSSATRRANFSRRLRREGGTRDALKTEDVLMSPAGEQQSKQDLEYERSMR
eukprot:160807_1